MPKYIYIYIYIYIHKLHFELSRAIKFTVPFYKITWIIHGVIQIKRERTLENELLFFVK